jgi:Domain of Unknown Function (DUF349)
MEENIENQSISNDLTSKTEIEASNLNEKLEGTLAQEAKIGIVETEANEETVEVIVESENSQSETIVKAEEEIEDEVELIEETAQTTIEPTETIVESQISPVAEIEQANIVQEIDSNPVSITKNEVDIEPIANAKGDEIHEELEELAIDIHEEKIDYSQHSISELLVVLSKAAESVKSENASNADFKKADAQLKEIKVIFDSHKYNHKKEAIEKYKSENESDEGFEYKEDADSAAFDVLYKKIKEAKFQHFSDIEKNKEQNFTKKTDLLNQLRVLADSEDGNISTIKANIVVMKKLQQEWKEAGNITSPHNNTLWQTYHALVDRFYSNRGIYFELLELDRKKNMNLKVELCTKIEAIAQKVDSEELTSKTLQDVANINDEYKHIGPATKEANELLWQRFKVAMDTIYDKRRGQLEALKGTFEENLAEKQKVLDSLELFTSFKSESINEWMEQTKAIDILQKQWDAIKGPLPKDKTRDISKNFWNGVKQFYRNKGDFFKGLEAKREENLKQKQALCEQVETFLASEEDSSEITKTVIKLQEDWRKIGHVPEKFRNKIYERFKVACDGYFNKKRQKTTESDKVFIENLVKKQALCQKIEDIAKESTGIEQLSELKKEWAAIGFVPKFEMVAIQKRYITAINSFVGAIGKLTDKEKEKLTLQNEVEILKQSDKSDKGSFAKDLGRKEGDIRTKIQNLENDLSTLKNNLEFFARSKNADKLRQDFEEKIKKGEEELTHMKNQLKVVRQAAD